MARMQTNHLYLSFFAKLWILDNGFMFGFMLEHANECHTLFHWLSFCSREAICSWVCLIHVPSVWIYNTISHAEVPTLPFWAEDLPLYVISPVLPFDRKISRWRKLKIFRSFYPFPNCPAIAFFIENSTERERKRAWVKRCCNIYF